MGYYQPFLQRTQRNQPTTLCADFYLYSLPLICNAAANEILAQLLDGNEAEWLHAVIKAPVREPPAHNALLNLALKGLANDTNELVAARAVRSNNAVRRNLTRCTALVRVAPVMTGVGAIPSTPRFECQM